MKLYKFRSLETEEKVNRTLEIIDTGQFYCAERTSLNDPMEGFFRHYINENHPHATNLRDFIYEKNRLRICSFSHTFRPILLWSMYADDHKGVAIEIELNSNEYENLHRVRYVRRIPDIDFANTDNPVEVLTKKIRHWRHEQEFRILDPNELVEVGRITGVLFGIRTSDEHKETIIEHLQDRDGDNEIKPFDTKINFNDSVIAKREE